VGEFVFCEPNVDVELAIAPGLFDRGFNSFEGATGVLSFLVPMPDVRPVVGLTAAVLSRLFQVVERICGHEKSPSK